MRQELKNELDALAEEAKRAGTTLKSERVVEWAESNKQSALHVELFKDDDSEAARRYRLQLAGQLVRAYVKVIPHVAKPVRALAHLPSDQKGYRKVEDVVSNPMFRDELVNDALARVVRMKESFAFLPELTPFWEQLDKLVDQFRQAMSERRSAG